TPISAVKWPTSLHKCCLKVSMLNRNIHDIN
ncbi:MAG: hypothetical protein ACJA13_002706, partial [Paraglaciecola sp.]